MDGPGQKRKPQACQYFGRLTFLTVQSNILLTLYHALRHARPESYIAVHAYPYAFAAGVGLTINYYGLDHFLPEKIAEDKRWIAKGYTMIPVANHLEHGLALPSRSGRVLHGQHAGQCTLRDGRLALPRVLRSGDGGGAALGLLGRRDAGVAVLLRARRAGARGGAVILRRLHHPPPPPAGHAAQMTTATGLCVRSCALSGATNAEGVSTRTRPSPYPSPYRLGLPSRLHFN